METEKANIILTGSPLRPVTIPGDWDRIIGPTYAKGGDLYLYRRDREYLVVRFISDLRGEIRWIRNPTPVSVARATRDLPEAFAEAVAVEALMPREILSRAESLGEEDAGSFFRLHNDGTYVVRGPGHTWETPRMSGREIMSMSWPRGSMACDPGSTYPIDTI